MPTLEIDDAFVCERCGHWVRADGCGFTFVEGKVRICERCPDVAITPTGWFKPILNTAEDQDAQAQADL